MKIQQIKFKVGMGNPEGGILIDEKYIITGYYGCVINAKDAKILERYDDWANISTQIIDDELPSYTGRFFDELRRFHFIS